MKSNEEPAAEILTAVNRGDSVYFLPKPTRGQRFAKENVTLDGEVIFINQPNHRTRTPIMLGSKREYHPTSKEAESQLAALRQAIADSIDSGLQQIFNELVG
jgi:hypothetical protein